MSYRYVYPSGGANVGAAPVSGYNGNPALMSAGYPNGIATNMYNDHRRRSYSPESFSSDSASSDEYEYRGRMITRETRRPRDVVRAPTPPPIIKRVVERAPTPEAPVMERVIIRPQAQEIVERVIEQPRTPPPRIIQKEMQEEAPPPIVRTRVIKVDRPLRSGYSQPGSPYSHPSNGLPSFSNAAMGCGNGYRNHSVVGSVGRPVAYHNVMDHNPSFSSGSSFEYAPPGGPPTTMMMMPSSQQTHALGVMSQQPIPSMNVMQQPQQSMNVMQQQPVSAMGVMPQQTIHSMGMMQQQPVHQQVMYRPVQMQSSMPQMQSSMPQMAPQSVPPLPSPYMSQNYMNPVHQGMPFGYPSMMHQGGMVHSGMPMMASGNTLGAPPSGFPGQPPMFNPMPQQLVY